MKTKMMMMKWISVTASEESTRSRQTKPQPNKSPAERRTESAYYIHTAYTFIAYIIKVNRIAAERNPSASRCNRINTQAHARSLARQDYNREPEGEEHGGRRFAHCVNHGIIYEKTLFTVAVAVGIIVSVVVAVVVEVLLLLDYPHQFAAINAGLPLDSLWI